jgi:hypothetical protein
MILDEAIDQLIALREKFDGSVELRFVFDRTWPIAYGVAGICTESDVIDRYNSEISDPRNTLPSPTGSQHKVYIVQGRSCGYAAKKIFEIVDSR